MTTTERLESIDSKLSVLIEYQRRRDAREEAALEVERDRRDRSAEAQARHVEAEITERAARGTWLRSLITREMILPLLAGIISTLAAIGGVSALQGPSPPVQQVQPP